MKKSLIFVLVSSIVTIFSCQKETKEPFDLSYDDLEYNIYMGGKLAGYQKSTMGDDGNYYYTYEFNDRGRGPKLNEKISLNDNGVIVSQKISGHSYLKDTVNEVFKIKNGIAKWKSSSEQGETKFDDNSFFSAINSSIGASDLLIRKLLATVNKEVQMLPSGTVKITSMDHHRINDSIDLRLVEFKGQSFTPSYLWIDTNDRFFGYASPWFTCIQKGYDSIAKQLEPIQKQKGKQYLKNLSESLVEIPSKKVLIKNVKMFDADAGVSIPNMFVLINKDRIEKISKTEIQLDNDPYVIDGMGKMLLPGLFDMHTHISDTDGLMHLAAGVTSVRDLGNSADLPELKQNFDKNKLLGPRIVVMSGFIDKAGPYAAPTGAIINNLEEGFTAIDEYNKNGYKQIKLYSSIEPEWVKPLADKAHSLGMRVSGHIPAYMIAEQAVNNGYDEIQHANMLALNFLSDTIDTRQPLRFTMVAEHTHKLDFDSERFKEFIKLLKDKKVVIDPTISIFDGMFTTKAGEANPSFSKILNRLPLDVQRGFYSGGLPIPDGKEDDYKASYNKLLAMVNELYKNEVTIVPGTDAMAGFGLHTELENYVKAGIPASQVLKIATAVSAKVAGVANDLGTIEEGKLADLILVDGNPTHKISDIRKVVLTIKDGNIYTPESLYDAIGVSTFK